MRRITIKEVEEVRIIDRKQSDGKWESVAYIKARDMWFKDARRLDERQTEFNPKKIIREFVAFQETCERVDGPED